MSVVLSGLKALVKAGDQAFTAYNQGNWLLVFNSNLAIQAEYLHKIFSADFISIINGLPV